jgi:hypothetical protein
VPGDALTDAADRYVALVLAVGVHDPDYVDAYYGPPERRTEAIAARRSLEAIDRDASDLLTSLTTMGPPAAADDIVRLRYAYLTRQLASLRSRVALLQDGRLTFDQESLALYDAVAPRIDVSVFETAIEQLGRRLPGRGSVLERYEAYRQQLVIPRHRLEATFAVAIAAGRARTRKHIVLPAAERFDVEHVTGKSWSGYNWYQG